jgi:hypothetical protein
MGNGGRSGFFIIHDTADNVAVGESRVKDAII